ncbi:unnamed protein product [Darwinula stevensoni]|uniref:Uncharacterized protein n=1 Tax=Darwinula stevensoni TaxID=69355 RepID=A0A7R8XC60_9CRUS|nr:unnamed protein product [Darwinula stevensoni]CAG0891684.1 unnamed protein product [Darwinula stevensoni]
MSHQLLLLALLALAAVALADTQKLFAPAAEEPTKEELLKKVVTKKPIDPYADVKKAEILSRRKEMQSSILPPMDLNSILDATGEWGRLLYNIIPYASGRQVGLLPAAGLVVLTVMVIGLVIFGVAAVGAALGVGNVGTILGREAQALAGLMPEDLTSLASNIHIALNPQAIEDTFDAMGVKGEACRKRALCDIQRLATRHPWSRKLLDLFNTYVPGLERYSDAITAALEDRDCALEFDSCRLGTVAGMLGRSEDGAPGGDGSQEYDEEEPEETTGYLVDYEENQKSVNSL